MLRSILFDDITEQFWDEKFQLNLRPFFFAAQAAAPGMRARGRGSIINLGSITWHAGFADLAVYSAAKAGVLNLKMFLAREWATKGVRVNAITPGFFPAEQNRKLLFNEDVDEVQARTR